MTNNNRYYEFYSSVNRDQVYTKETCQYCHGFYRTLKAFIENYELKTKRLLEVGSGKGLFQHIVENYIGLDIVESLRKYYKSPEKYVVVKDGEPYPFPDNFVDAAFTYASFEHIPNVEIALGELLRVVKHGGYILFHSRWQVLPWVSKGLAVRSFSDLPFKAKLVKLTIPIREAMIWRALFVFPKRMWRTLQFLTSQGSHPDSWFLDYRKLDPNYEQFWQSDSDACNHIDIHSAILWFMSRKCEVVGYPTLKKAFLARTGAFIVKVTKSG